MSTQIPLPVAELKPALTGLSKIISNKTTLPVFGMILINRDSDGWITLTGTDLDVTATVRLEQPAQGEPFSILVPHGDLHRIAKNTSPGDIITVESADKEHACVKYPVGSTTTEQKVPSLPVEEFPQIPRIEGKSFPIEPTVRLSILEGLQFASQDETRYILRGVYVDVSQKTGHYIVGTDGRCLYSSNSFNLPLKESLVIPDHRFLGWKGFFDDGDWHLTVGAKADTRQFMIASRRWSLIARAIEGNYPNWKQVVPEAGAFKTHVELDELDAIIKLIPKIPCDKDDQHQHLGLKISGRKFHLLGWTKESGESAELEIASAQVTGKDVTVWLNRKYLLKALSFGLSRIEIIDELAPIRVSSDGRQLIIMPVRPPGVATAPKTEQPSPEAAAPAEKPAPVNEPEQHERSQMARTTNGNGHDTTSSGSAPTDKPSLEAAIEQIEAAKESLKTANAGLNSLLATIKAAQREQKNSTKEVESVRSTLRSLQSVRI